MTALLGAILSITIIDLALSGDNAAVIGLAIRNLPQRQRQTAALVGAGGAIALRVTLTAIATLLLRVPFLNAIGGGVLVWVTWKLLEGGEGEAAMEAAGSFWGAIGTIMVADLSMSFDNVMGVAGAAHGSVALMILGLVISIPVLVAGSSWLARLMNRYPIVIFVGGAVLAHTALSMVFDDSGLHLARYTGEIAAHLIPWVAALAVFLWGWLRLRSAAVRVETEQVETDLSVMGDALEHAATREQE